MQVGTLRQQFLPSRRISCKLIELKSLLAANRIAELQYMSFAFIRSAADREGVFVHGIVGRQLLCMAHSNNMPCGCSVFVLLCDRGSQGRMHVVFLVVACGSTHYLLSHVHVEFSNLSLASGLNPHADLRLGRQASVLVANAHKH